MSHDSRVETKGTSSEAADAAARAWAIFCDMVLAARRGDGQAAALATRKVGPDDDLLAQAVNIVGTYLIPALAKAVLGTRPGRSGWALRRASRRLGPSVRLTVVVSDEQVRDVLRIIYHRHPRPSSVQIGNFLIIGSALLGCALDDPDAALRRERDAVVAYAASELDAMRNEQ